ncbi:aminotransferase class I/II-fold pyridoxal phosphate-dependent enzyme [Pusillimonas sp. TS35]|uniref:pyridoxal phosphate-dependent aminotransferase n=1 Tax=Paracandidimonas lactea TaxID=2895524 RepID=UPI00136E021B|nr:pyridoxal phosphate-dependent aminotransferase [Paracandidimonas lactea]MYN12642.1 aminotransferase class I/II-fold pyridoxal phosphate-dependent enzyme [Pusillimonas sp. TS35]
MDWISEKFRKLGTDDAPGQEVRQQNDRAALQLKGHDLPGRPVDFSHGDVDAFTPIPGAFEAFAAGVERGGAQAYTEYRGALAIRQDLAAKLTAFTGSPVQGDDDMIITSGTQGALFLAVACTVARGTKVAIVQPDYFANRKLVEFFEGDMVPVRMDYLGARAGAGLDLTQLEDAFKAGVKVFLFSNPNNPAGVIYSSGEIRDIASLASRYGVTVIVDQLYSRLLYSDAAYTHLRAQAVDQENVITIIGPSKTESMSGYRLGVAFGAPAIISRMEKLQAIVSLRAAGYNQAVLKTWFDEPAGWMTQRIAYHQAIRDDLLALLRTVGGLEARTPEAGSYLFPRLPELSIPPANFVRALRLQAGVTVTPGTEFSPHAANSIRFNFSQDHQAAVQAVERTVALIARYRR